MLYHTTILRRYCTGVTPDSSHVYAVDGAGLQAAVLPPVDLGRQVEDYLP